jgi:hypothetical protein
MHYSITQKTTKKVLYFFSTEVEKTYKFEDYNKALIFALNEQINKIVCNFSDSVKTTRKPFQTFYKVDEFLKVATNNPIHFLGTRQKVNKALFYYYLINSNQLHKLKKHI